MTIQNAVRSISKNRLATYKDRLRLSNEAECLGLYIWNKKLCGVFLPILQLLEVSLRNAVHEGFLAHQKKSLLEAGPPPGDVNILLDRAWFKTFFNANQAGHEESYKNIQFAEQTLARMGRPLDIDQIIAKLSYGFWSHLCSKRHNETNPDSLQLWPKIREEVFPGSTKGTTHTSMKEIQETLHQVNDIRNRIAHHEPIWHVVHLYDLPTFINKLVRDFTKCLDVIGWINPSNLKTVTLMESAVEFSQLVDPATIESYKKMGNMFTTAAAIDPQVWALANAVEDRHNGVVIRQDTLTVIKSLKDKNTFVLDTKAEWQYQSSLGLKLHAEVHFRPARSQSKGGKITFLARSVGLGHI